MNQILSKNSTHSKCVSYCRPGSFVDQTLKETTFFKQDVMMEIQGLHDCDLLGLKIRSDLLTKAS